jgi:hypothetical protein
MLPSEAMVSLSYQNYVSDPCFYGNLPYLHNGLHKNDMVWSSIEIRDAMVNYLIWLWLRSSTCVMEWRRLWATHCSCQSAHYMCMLRPALQLQCSMSVNERSPSKEVCSESEDCEDGDTNMDLAENITELLATEGEGKLNAEFEDDYL